MAHLVTYGELLLRLNCPGIQRFSQIDHLEISVAGAEANVAVAAKARLGKAFKLAPEMRGMALNDEDLKALWDALSGELKDR